MSFQPVTKQQWIDALRSGKYDQCTGALAKPDPDTGAMSYCCLGVLATIAGVEYRRDAAERALECGGDFIFDDDNWECGIIPEAFRSIIVSDLDLSQPVSTLTQDDLMRVLSSKNDNGASFNDIAAFIEGLK